MLSIIAIRSNSHLTHFLNETTVGDKPGLYYVWISAGFCSVLTEAELASEAQREEKEKENNINLSRRGKLKITRQKQKLGSSHSL